MISDVYFDRFETPKYRNRNPLHRWFIKRFVDVLHSMFIEAGPVTRVLEIGVGEGFISGYLSEKFTNIHFTGVDVRESDIARLRSKFPRVEGRTGDIYDLGALPGGYDLVICAEVLEHLDEPDRALASIAALHPRHVLLSVPHEPWFMLGNLARGKNVTRLGNDIEHVNHYGTGSFRRLLEARFEILRMATSFPWILALLAPR